MMVLFDHEEQAGLLQTNFQQLITTIEQSMNIIWPPEEASVNQAQISQVGTGGEKFRSDWSFYFDVRLKMAVMSPVLPGPPNPDHISDQKMKFSTPAFRSDL